MNAHPSNSLSLRVLLCILLCAGWIGGCANTQPILNYPTMAVPTLGGHAQHPVHVHDAIVHALTKNRWMVMQDDTTQGVIYASVLAGGHSAQVRVVYSAQAYSIEHHASSPGLRYDGRHIHRRYNNWVKTLNAQIQRQLSVPPTYAIQPMAAPTGPQPAPTPVQFGAPPTATPQVQATPLAPPTDTVPAQQP